MGETGEDTNRFFIKMFFTLPPSYQRVLCVFFRLKILYKNFIILKITTLIVAYLILVDQTLK